MPSLRMERSVLLSRWALGLAPRLNQNVAVLQMMAILEKELYVICRSGFREECPLREENEFL